MTAKLLIQPTTMMHAVSDHGVTTLVITQGDCRMELAMASDRVQQFYGDLTEALTPPIHEATLHQIECACGWCMHCQNRAGFKPLAKAAPRDS
jgi:hypothetical protein